MEHKTFCDFTPCKEPAVNHIQWGKHELNQQANVCVNHLYDLHESVNAQIGAGVCWWTQSEPKEREPS